MDLRHQLQQTLGAQYVLERELGGGGMSRVFVATETALGRKVVVKVLAPELTQGVSVERFKREIQLSAQLQHPHIVPVLTTGETAGLPFYTMPFVEGASLRAHLAKAGALPTHEAIGILRDVAKALGYAHERGVVHRDIKPDNVLLTGGSAVVTDFGIAKALAASRQRVEATDESAYTLTQIGTSLGTPAYMAPEQAAADPSTDHRADLYAFGCVAYEVLTGRPPFTDRSPQKLLAAHMGEKPKPIAELRGDLAPVLAELVMKCLEKEPAQRPRGAQDLVRVLDTVTSGGSHEAMPAILLGGRPNLWRALAVYAGAVVAVLVVAKAAIVGIGLPTWAFPGAAIVMALGFPAILFTAFVHRGAHDALTMAQRTPTGTPVAHSTMTRLAVKASPFVNWRRTTMAGVAALGLFMALVAGYMITRAMGIGPAASLIGSGVLGQREKLVIADFKSPASGDTTLGPVVTEAFRSNLAQSPNVDVMQPTSVRSVLLRMQRSPDTRIDFALAREIATREGAKAVMDGEVLSLGGSYVLDLRLLAAQTGDVLATFRETASDAAAIIPAIDRLTRDVRTKIGESLRSINTAPELERVTTSSLDALKKYVQGTEVFTAGSDFNRGVQLMEEAIALDTGFAMAYRKLAIELENYGGFDDRALAALAKAYAHRDRLSETERYITEGSYWENGPKPDPTKALAALEGLLTIDTANPTALINASVLYLESRQFEKAEQYTKRAVAVRPAQAAYDNLTEALFRQGKLAEMETTVDAFSKKLPNSVSWVGWKSALAETRDQFDSVELYDRSVLTTRHDPGTLSFTSQMAGTAAAARGQLARADKYWRDAAAFSAQQGVATAGLTAAIQQAIVLAWFKNDAKGATLVLDAAVQASPLQKLPAIERPYMDLATAYAMAGHPERSRALVAAFDETRKTVARRSDDHDRHFALGVVAEAERNYRDAVTEFRAADTWGCLGCVLPELGRVYDLAGSTDSALAVFTRFAEHRNWSDPFTDAQYLAGTYKRLGELYEARGDKARAAHYYSAFVNLWKNADPELQPKVADARARLARLGDLEPKR